MVPQLNRHKSAEILASAYSRLADHPSIKLAFVNAPLDTSELRRVAITWCSAIGNLNSQSAFIAGGFIRDFYLNSKSRDLDLYFPSELEATEFESELRNLGWRLLGTSECVRSWIDSTGKLVDVVRLKTTPEECLGRFDLTISCAAWEIAKEITICTCEFLKDCKNKSITLVNPALPSHTMLRIQNLQALGYVTAHSELEKLDRLIQASQ